MHAASSVLSTTQSPAYIKPLDEKDLVIQLEKIKNGTHEELLRRKLIVDKDIDKKIAAADRFRKLQIKNIHDLYEYEVNVLQAQREVTI